MKQSCTIYSSKENYQSINSLWKDLSYSESSVELSENELGGITLQTKTGTLELYFDRYKEGGDEFSGLILGTRNYFNQVETTHQAIKDNLLKFINSMQSSNWRWGRTTIYRNRREIRHRIRNCETSGRHHF